MSNKIPCCYGCMLYGHRDGCTCLPPEKRMVEIPLAIAERIAEGKQTDLDRKKVSEAAFRVIHGMYGVSGR